MRISLKIFMTTLLLTIFLTTLHALAGARLSGKILSYNPNSKVYSVELKDGSKIKVKLSSTSKNLRSSGSGGFKTGETVVFNIISALNENPMIADSVMDVAYARANNNPTYVMPRNTPIGGTATIAGPVITGGSKPNIIGGMATGGSVPQDPTLPLTIPGSTMTVSSSAATSPVIGNVLTNPPQSNMLDTSSGSGDFSQPILSPLNSQGPSNINHPQTQGDMQSPSLNLTTGPASPAYNSDPSALITGSSKPNTPQTMIYSGGAFGKNGGDAMQNSAMMLGGDDEEEEEEEDPFKPSMHSGVGSPVQVNAQIMKVDIRSNVLFYMVIGAQELGSATITTQTKIINGASKKTISFSEIPAGSKAVISGVKQSGDCINATSIVIVP